MLTPSHMALTSLNTQIHLQVCLPGSGPAARLSHLPRCQSDQCPERCPVLGMFTGSFALCSLSLLCVCTASHHCPPMTQRWCLDRAVPALRGPPPREALLLGPGDSTELGAAADCFLGRCPQLSRVHRTQGTLNLKCGYFH